MFFGCRSKEADCHYRDELEAMASSGDLQFRVAASRDQVFFHADHTESPLMIPTPFAGS
jgi:sulfite reductase alpha subunit-like flavoprotein